MVRGPGYGTYEPNPNFANGATMQTPPPGTIPRGMPALGFGPGFAEARRAFDTLLEPAGLGRIRVLAQAKGAPLDGLRCLQPIAP